MTTATRRWAGIALRMAIAIGLLALAIRSNRSSIDDVLRRKPDLTPFLGALGLYLAGLILSYGRWLILVHAVGIPLRFRDALRLGFIGALFNFVIPGAIAGVFVRAAYLCRERPDKKGPAIASSFTDLILGLLGLFSLAIVSGLVDWSSLRGPSRRLVIAACIFAGVFAGMLVVAFTPAITGPLSRRAARRHKPSRLLAELIVTGETYRRRLWVVPMGVVLGAGTHALNIVAFWAVGRALFPDVPSLAEHFRIVPLVLFSTAIPLPFGALGASEQVSTYLFRSASYPGGGVAMMAFRVLQIGGALVGLVIYLANLTQMRALREQAKKLVEETDLDHLAADVSSG